MPIGGAPMLPNTVSILGIPYKVERGGVEPGENGSCSPSTRTIRVRNGLCPEEEAQVYIHEVVHAVLAGLACYDLYEDERLVQGLAIGLHQALPGATSCA